MITLVLVSYTTTTITVNWQEDGDHVLDISHYDVIYTADSHSQIQQCSGCSGLELTGLRPGTEYTITVTGYSKYGWNASNIVYAQTDPAPTQRIDVVSQDHNNIGLYWQVGVTNYNSFNVMYNPESEPHNKRELNTLLPMATLGSLQPDTRYSIQVFTQVSFGDRETSSSPSTIVVKTDVDYCVANNCALDATCLNHADRFTCVCPEGKGGRTCGHILVPDSCQSNPCSGNATCVNGPETYICLCPNGFKGRQCEIDTSQTAVVMTVSLENAVFKDELNDKNSAEYKQLEGDIISEIVKMYLHDDKFEGVEIIEFKPGSIIVVMNIIMSTNATSEEREGAVQLLTGSLNTNGLLNYTTSNISYQTDLCQNSPCQNGGLCLTEGKSYVCYCRDNFIGVNCENVVPVQVENPQVENPIEVLQIEENGELTNPLFEFTSLVTNPSSVKYYSLKSTEHSAFFVLNSTTGQLKTTLPNFDRETNANFEIEVDLIGASTNTTLILVIEVIDVNDNAPKFEDTPYECTVMEYSPPGSSITKVTAADADLDAVLTYSLAGSTATNAYFKTLFSIDSQTGAVTLNGVLNRKRLRQDNYIKLGESLVLPISVSDGDFTSNGTVFIDVEPLFVKLTTVNESMQTAYVKEDIQPGSFVVDAGVDFDREDDDITYNYRIFESYKNFNINETTGVVTTAGPLDRELQDADNFTVIALENQCLAGHETLVVVHIEDVNDNTPVFDKSSYFAEIREDVGPSQTVVIIPEIRATDKDEGINAEIQYSLSGIGHGQFSIEPDTGVVMTTNQINLDFESTKTYSLVVTARDLNGNVSGHWSEVPLVINVTDANDNQPVFTQIRTNYNISENTPGGTVIAVVTATDADEGLNGQLLYTFQSGSEGKFGVNIDTGELTILGELDRETKGEYDLVISARDQGLPVQQASIDLRITVTDINDNTPRFTDQSYTVHVSEDAELLTTILTVTAMDPDKDENGSVTYSISGTTTFAIDAVNGAIFLNDSLDRDFNEETYTFDVTAEDGGVVPRWSVTTVEVVVDDVNDNAPLFTKDVYSSTLLASSAISLINGTIVTVVSATDSDAGVNAEVYYTVEHPQYNETFEIDRSGIVRVSMDTMEPSSTIAFDITARNVGDASMFDTSRVHITIERPSTNLNFDKTLYEFTVTENLEGQHYIGSVQVSNTSDVIYGLTFDIPGISVDNETGNIYTSSPFDRELTPVLRFNVLARSEHNVEAFAFTTAMVKIEDVNDVTPYFKDPIGPVFTVVDGLRENAVNDSFLRIHVYDGDEGNNGKILFTIVDGNYNDTFDIRHVEQNDNDIIGMISVNAPADREERDLFTLIVTVEDMGSVSLTSTITIEIPIIDENDNDPHITTETEIVTLQETVPILTEVAFVKASDPDAGVNGDIIFKLIDDADGHFSIDENTGSIRTAKSIDREAADQHIIIAIAEDKGVPSRQSPTPQIITFDVEDYNDNEPQFVNLPYFVVLPKNATIHSVVIQVHATDEDVDRNADVTYEIIGSGGCSYGLFVIDQSDGTIRNTRRLYNEPTGVCRLSVRATDNGIIPLSKVEQVEVNITEVNNPPEFESNLYWQSIPENHPVGATVKTEPNNPKAHDNLDEGENAVIVYEILSGNNTDLFTIDSNTGIISLAEPLDRETLDVVRFSIVARDVSPVPKSNTAYVIINITDVNDNSPELQLFHEAIVPQNSRPGYIVAELNVRDDDIGENTDCFFAFGRARFGREEKSPLTYFDIDDTKGIITTKDALYDQNLTSSISIEMIAVVSNQQPIVQTHISTSTGPAYTWIDVLFASQYIPSCAKDVYFLSIPEDANIGMKLNVTLKPESNNSRPQPDLIFSITEGNVDNTFGLDIETSDVSIRKELKLDVQQYNLTIEATVDDILPKIGTCFIIIEVEPVTTTASMTTNIAEHLTTDKQISETGLVTIIGTATLSAVLFLVLIIVSTICYGKNVMLRNQLPKHNAPKKAKKEKKAKPHKTPKWVKGRPLPRPEGEAEKEVDEKMGITRETSKRSRYLRYMDGPKHLSSSSWDADYNEVEDYLEPGQSVGLVPDYLIPEIDYDLPKEEIAVEAPQSATHIYI